MLKKLKHNLFIAKIYIKKWRKITIIRLIPLIHIFAAFIMLGFVMLSSFITFFIFLSIGFILYLVS